jgi:hypothetical protein
VRQAVRDARQQGRGGHIICFSRFEGAPEHEPWYTAIIGPLLASISYAAGPSVQKSPKLPCPGQLPFLVTIVSGRFLANHISVVIFVRIDSVRVLSEDDTPFMKRLRIAVRAICFVINLVLFRPLESSGMARAIVGAGKAAVGAVLGLRRSSYRANKNKGEYNEIDGQAQTPRPWVVSELFSQ